MQSSALLEATASEPLSLEEEYTMQRSWRDDPKKCTFIIHAQDKNGTLCMVGDTNLFFNDHEDPFTAEIEIMIAEPTFRRRGIATKALKSMMAYGHLVLGVARFVAKIGYANSSSLALFTSTELGYRMFEKHDWCEETHCAFDVRDVVNTDSIKISEWAAKTTVHTNVPPDDEEYNLPCSVWNLRWFRTTVQSLLEENDVIKLATTNCTLLGLFKATIRKPYINTSIDTSTVQPATLLNLVSGDSESLASEDSDESVPNKNFSGVALFETESMWFLDMAGGELKFAGTSIFLSDSTVGNSHANDTGNITWDGAIAMAKWLERHPSVCHHRRVLELGAGTGLVGLSTLTYGASHVYLTDLLYCLPIAQANVDKNIQMESIVPGCVEVRVLDWFDQKHAQWSQQELENIEVLVAADVIWQRELVKPYSDTVVCLLKRMNNGVAYVLYTSRYGEEFDAFVLATLQSSGLSIEAQAHDEMDSVYRYDEAVVWKLTLTL